MVEWIKVKRQFRDDHGRRNEVRFQPKIVPHARLLGLCGATALQRLNALAVSDGHGDNLRHRASLTVWVSIY